MVALLVAFLWFIVKLVVIWAVAYGLKVLIEWAPIIPAPLKRILWYAVAVVAFIFTIVVLVGFIGAAPWPAMSLLLPLFG